MSETIVSSTDVGLLRRVWNDATAQAPLELVSPLKRDELVRRLAASIDSGWVYFGSKPAVGIVGQETFRLRWRINYRNSFQTVLFGRLVDEGRRTRLMCRTGMHPAVAVFMAFWLGIVGLVAIAGLSGVFEAPALDGARAGFESVVPTLMLVFGILLVSLGRWFARDERQHLIAFLGRVVDARPPP